jgi:hypothetical protein
MGAWLAAKFTGFGAKVALIGGIIATALAALFAVIAELKRSGRDAQRADTATAALRRNSQAAQARQKAELPVTQQEEANDPYNRDRR